MKRTRCSRTGILHLGLLTAALVVACGSEPEPHEAAASGHAKPPPIAFRWELEDRSQLRATATPWPPQAEVPAVIRVMASTGSWGVRLVERVDLQLSGSPRPVDHWLPMKPARDDGKTLVLEAPVRLRQGRSWVHVRIHKHGGAGTEILEPWKLEALAGPQAGS